ncbi:MAG: ThuA domain-containing protein, partial [Chloroflexi bacterium]|nr:ThuA domain-containing protein [Chloroflexota bacterium]
MMNILVLCDDAYHPAHVVRAGLSPLEGYTFDFIEDATAWDAERLALYPAAIVAKSN